MRGHTPELNISVISKDKEKNKERLATCWDFVISCDKYNACEVTSAVAKHPEAAFNTMEGVFDKGTFVFALSRPHKDNPTRQIIVAYLVERVLDHKTYPDFLEKQSDEVIAAVMKAMIKLADSDGPEDGKHLATMWRRNDFYDGYNSDGCPNCGECLC